MKRSFLCFLVVLILLVPLNRASAFGPAVAVLGAEGLAVLEGIAIRTGIQVVSREAMKTAVKGFAQQAGKQLLGKVDDIIKTGVKSVDGKYVRYMVAGTVGIEVGSQLAEYIESLNTSTDIGMDDTVVGVPVPVPVEMVPDDGFTMGGEWWYAVPYGRDLVMIDGKYRAVYRGVTIHYLDPGVQTWLSGDVVARGLAGSFGVKMGAFKGEGSIGNQEVFVRYTSVKPAAATTTGSITLKQAFPTSGTALVNENYPKGGVITGNPPVVLPFPNTGDMPMVIPSDFVISDPTVLDREMDFPIDPTVPPGTTNPPWELPNTATINFEPLKIAGDQLTHKFPFSIPWDIKRQLSVFDVEPQTPVLKVDKTIPVFGSQMKLNFNIDFSMFDPIAAVARWFLIIGFDIAIVLSIRRLLPE